MSDSREQSSVIALKSHTPSWTQRVGFFAGQMLQDNPANQTLELLTDFIIPKMWEPTQ